MILESIQNVYDSIYNQLKEYLIENSQYNPYIFKREPNDKKFPIVIIKELENYSVFTTLKYTDEIYLIDMEINVYAIQNRNIANMTIANEITNLIEKFFKENYKIKVKTSRDVANIDTNVFRNIVRISFKVDTKYKGKLIISPQ